MEKVTWVLTSGECGRISACSTFPKAVCTLAHPQGPVPWYLNPLGVPGMVVSAELFPLGIFCVVLGTPLLWRGLQAWCCVSLTLPCLKARLLFIGAQLWGQLFVVNPDCFGGGHPAMSSSPLVSGKEHKNDNNNVQVKLCKSDPLYQTLLCLVTEGRGL